MKKNFFYLRNLIIAVLRVFLRIDSRIKNYNRKKIGIFEYNNLSLPLKNYTFQTYNGNNTYGILKNLKKYSSFNGIEKVAIEHGYYIGEFVYENEINYSKLLTFSKEREEIINRKSNNSFGISIGPYIHYIDSFYSETEMINLKKFFGKTLLVFPTHSLECIDIVESNFLIKKIEEIKNDYNTVLVCLYYADIQKGIDKLYKKYNYKIVTAGHRYDVQFLNRLKSIIQLSDYSISNFFGTHTIYCTHLNKPHTIFFEELKYEENKKFVGSDISKIALEEIAINDFIYQKQMKLIKKYYTAYPNSLEILQIKKELNYMFGFEEIKTPMEIKKILGE